MNKIKIHLYRIIGKKYPIITLNGFIFLLLFLIVIIPEQKQLAEFKSQLYRFELEHQKQTQQIAQAVKDQQQLDKLVHTWQRMQTSGIDLNQIDRVFTELESLAKQAHVDLSYETAQQMIKISLKSDYLSLLYFIESLIKKPYFLLENLQLKRESGFITTTFNLRILLAEEHV